MLLTTLTGVLLSCSTTSSLADGEQLFTGLKPIQWSAAEPSTDHASTTREEVEAALATAPNGALFGSSYYRTPFPYALWIWNACHGSDNVVKKWFNNSFGKAPVLMQNVNPMLRAQVAEDVLHNNGYFNGHVEYDIIEGQPMTTRRDSTPEAHTAKVQYKVDMGHLYRFDSIAYCNFPEGMADVLNQDTVGRLRSGQPFTVAGLDGERTRIYNVLRQQGYYYYQKTHVSFFADTINHPGNVALQVRLNDSLPSSINNFARRRWVIGSADVRIRKTMREQLTDSVSRRFLTIHFAGRKPSIRPGVLLSATKLRPGDIFAQSQYEESLNNLSSLGVFSSTDISFSPRCDSVGNPIVVPDSVPERNGLQRAGAGLLDMTIDATLDKPYDVTLQATGLGKTNGRLGPGLSLGLAKRNAFRGGELLSLELGASYEFQTSLDDATGSSYDFSLSANMTLPRLLMPRRWQRQRRRWYVSPQTIVSISGETIRKAGFFNRNVISADITYYFQPSAVSQHQFTPLSLLYGHTSNMTEAYTAHLDSSVTASIAARDELTPRMRYKYIYSSPTTTSAPIYWETTITQAGAITNALYSLIGGGRWNEEGKKLMNTAFSQFVKVETDVKKTWSMGGLSTFVAHAFAGIIVPYANSSSVPYAEQFFLGGANDMRGFSLHSIGPGSVHLSGRDMAYLFHNGDLKIVVNLEYRPHLFGSLYGALFVDAGNLWYLQSDRQRALEQLGYTDCDTKALDVGIDVGGGFRYDLDFFVLRLDWGLAIHSPYKTGRGGFFNIRKFSEAQCINFAIGYPF